MANITIIIFKQTSINLHLPWFFVYSLSIKSISVFLCFSLDYFILQIIHFHRFPFFDPSLLNPVVRLWILPFQYFLNIKRNLDKSQSTYINITLAKCTVLYMRICRLHSFLKLFKASNISLTLIWLHYWFIVRLELLPFSPLWRGESHVTC